MRGVQGRSMIRDEAGAMTFWLLVWTIGFLAFAGLAIDLTNAYRTRALLQSTADAAAHAGAMELLKSNSAANVPSRARQIALMNLDTSVYGDTVKLGDVEVGVWDGASFTPGGAPANAVRATARRAEANGNALPTSLLRIIAIADLDVAADAVAVLSYPDCPDDGIIARGQAKFTAQNAFSGDVCIHSQTELQISGVDAVSSGTVFSAPDIRQHNQGGDVNASTGAYAAIRNNLEEGWLVPYAAREDNVRNERINPLRTMIRGYGVPEWSDETTETSTGGTSTGGTLLVTPGYKSVNNMKNFDIQADIVAGYRYFELTCNKGNNRFDLPDGVDLSDVIIVSTCAIKANKAVTAYNTILAVDVPGDANALQFHGKSLNAETGTSCEDFGSLTLLSTGGVHLTADTNFTGVEIVATGQVKFTSGADLTLGLSIQSWDDVEFSAKATIDGCGSVPNDQTEFARFIRMAS